MEFRIEIDPQTGWSVMRIIGDVVLDDFPGLFATAWQHPGYGKADKAIWDFSRARASLRFEDIAQLTKWISANKQDRGPSTVAIVAPDDLGFGLSRTYDALLPQQQRGWTVSVFRTEDAARRWLQERSAPS